MADNASTAHRWWHDGRGYRHAFCLFCGTDYMTTVDPYAPDEPPCPAPHAAGGEAEAQRILARLKGKP